MTEEYRDDVDEMDGDEQGGIGQWLQDNLRIIISMIIVLLLALGIYSYSQRSQDVRTVADAPVAAADKAVDGVKNAAGAVTDKIGDAVKSGKAADTAGSVKAADDKTATAVKAAVAVVAQDKETDDAFVTYAQSGNGRTHLARRALASYVEKSNVTGLTGAHKVYIEDYLQKNVGGSTMVKPGQEMRFSKDLIKKAVERAQGLTPAQLKNLEKYAVAASL